jgi:hypothetical protein
VVVRDRRRREDVTPAGRVTKGGSSYEVLMEEGAPERVAPAVFRFPQREEFPREQTVLFLLRWYLKYAEHHMYSSIVLFIFL